MPSSASARSGRPGSPIPTYEYVCGQCGGRSTARRLFSEREQPEPCPAAGCSGLAEVVFTPNGNFHIPMRHTAEHGITWGDVFDVSEKELAKDPRVEKADRVFSQPGRNPRAGRNPDGIAS